MLHFLTWLIKVHCSALLLVAIMAVTSYGNELDPCAAGDWEGCHSLGWRAAQAGEVDKAKGYYEQSCAGGLPKSCNNLAWLHHRQGNQDAHVQYLNQACQIGHRQACAHAAQIVRCQQPAQQNSCLAAAKSWIDNKQPQQALSDLRVLCKAPYEDSCVQLGIAHELLGDWDQALVAYEKACAQGFGQICLRIGNFFSTEGLLHQSQEYFDKACAAGERLGCLRANQLPVAQSDSQNDQERLITICHGDRSPVHCIAAGKAIQENGDTQRALQFFEKACDAGEAYGCISAAALYHQLENLSQARAKVQQACNYVFPEDCDSFRRSACTNGYGWNCGATAD